METKYKVIIAISAIATAYAIGRWTAPEKVKIETKIVEVEKKTKDETTDYSKTKHKKVVVTEITYPDGRKEKKTVITDDTSVDKKTDSNETDETSRTEETKKETVKSSSRLVVLGLVGTDFTKPSTPVYGASVSKEILGPISLGVWGLSSGVGGASVGLSF